MFVCVIWDTAMANAMLPEYPFSSYLLSFMFAHVSIVVAAARRCSNGHFLQIAARVRRPNFAVSLPCGGQHVSILDDGFLCLLTFYTRHAQLHVDFVCQFIAYFELVFVHRPSAQRTNPKSFRRVVSAIE